MRWEPEAQSPAQLCQMLGLAVDQKLMRSPAEEGNWQKVGFRILWRIASFVTAHLTSSCRFATLKQLTNACDSISFLQAAKPSYFAEMASCICLSHLSAKWLGFAAGQKLMLSHAFVSCLGVATCRKKFNKQDQVKKCSTEHDAK